MPAPWPSRREGARVVASDLDPAATEATVEAVRAAGGQAIGIPADAGNRAEAKHLIDETVARLGGLDVLYNNAGIAPVGRDGFTPNIAEDDWELGHPREPDQRLPVLQVRHSASWRDARARPSSTRRRRWRILPLGMMDAYAASKAGVAGLTKSMAPGCGQLGIRVNAICPGYVDTPMNAMIFGSDAFRDAFAREHAMGLQPPEEIAALAVFLASDEASSMTGAVLACDRGWTAFKRPAALAGLTASTAAVQRARRPRLAGDHGPSPRPRRRRPGRRRVARGSRFACRRSAGPATSRR